MADFAGADAALKNFPILQMIVGGVVALVAILMTIRATRDNKKDGHIAPQGHDPYGVVVMMNSALAQLGIIAENSRHILARLHDSHQEQVKTNSRLAEMQDSHASEMDRLRDAVERLEPDRR